MRVNNPLCPWVILEQCISENISVHEIINAFNQKTGKHLVWWNLNKMRVKEYNRVENNWVNVEYKR